MDAVHESFDVIAQLAAEFCDAQIDTMQIVRHADLDLEWSSHIEYLQRLRRATQRALALATGGADWPRGTDIS
jgi:hypothetical protein